MRRSIRLALAVLGLGLAVYGALQLQSGSQGEPPQALTEQHPVEGGTMTIHRITEVAGTMPWHGLAAIVAGLALTGYALLGRRRRASGNS